jgi:DNA-binding beta-propeller fold protein YncE
MWLAALGGMLLGCSGSPPETPFAPDPPGDAPPAPARVLVVNALSETVSNLDPDAGTMTVQAFVAGSLVNRIAIVPDGRRLLVTNSGANRVTVRALHDLRRVFDVDLGVGNSPWSAAAIDDDRAVVSNWLSGTVRMVGLSTGPIGPPLEVTPGPEGIAVRDGFAWVAGTNWQSDGHWSPGRVDVVDLDAWQVVASVAVSTNPQDIVIGAGGGVHVLCTGDYAGETGRVHVIDPLARTLVGTVELGSFPTRLAADGRGTIWTVGPVGGLRRYDETTLARLPDPEDEALRGPGLSAVAVDGATGRVYVTSFDADLLLGVNPDDGTIEEVWLVGDGPVDVVVSRTVDAHGEI